MSATAEKSNKKCNPHLTGGWEFYGSKFEMSGTFHQLSRKSIFFGGGGRNEHFKVTKHQGLKSISGMQLS